MQQSAVLTKTLGILTLLVFLAFSPLSSAQNTPPASQGAIVALFTPFSFFEKSLHSIMTSYSTQDQAAFPDQVVSVDGLNWHISGISYSIQSEFTEGKLLPQSYEIQSRNLKLSISVQKISVDQVITTSQGGITLDVHVQATCAPLQLVQNAASASAQISYQFTPQSISTQVTQFNFQWPAQTWAISSLSCQGPAGIDSKIQAALASNLQSANTLKPYVQDALAAKIQDQVDSIVEQIKRPTPIFVPGNPLNLVLAFKQFQITKLGLISYGQITWNGIPDPSKVTPLGISDVPPELAGATEPVLITANQGWTNFIEAELAATPGTAHVSLNQQKSFAEILKSEFYEFFLWPDLLNYPAHAPFDLAIGTPQLTSLSWLADGTAQVEIAPAAWIEATRDNKVWNYVRLFGTALANIAPQISGGSFKLLARVRDSRIQYHFGADYVKAYRPNQFISSILVNQLSKNLETSFVFSNPLPSYDLGIIGVARFNGWVPINSGTHIAIPVQIVPPRI